MVRAALAGRSGALNAGPAKGARFIPAATVLAGSLLAALPIVSATGWWPNAGFLMLIAWRLRRVDPWPIWWAAPMGFVNDLLTGAPIGLSVSLWSGVMLAMELVDRRTQWRDYWVEWAIATVLITVDRWADWAVAGLDGAPVAFAHVAPGIAFGVLTFPLAAMVVSRTDRWRWGR